MPAITIASTFILSLALRFAVTTMVSMLLKQLMRYIDSKIAKLNTEKTSKAIKEYSEQQLSNIDKAVSNVQNLIKVAQKQISDTRGSSDPLEKGGVREKQRVECKAILLNCIAQIKGEMAALKVDWDINQNILSNKIGNVETDYKTRVDRAPARFNEPCNEIIKKLNEAIVSEYENLNETEMLSESLDILTGIHTAFKDDFIELANPRKETLHLESHIKTAREEKIATIKQETEATIARNKENKDGEIAKIERKLKINEQIQKMFDDAREHIIKADKAISESENALDILRIGIRGHNHNLSILKENMNDIASIQAELELKIKELQSAKTRSGEGIKIDDNNSLAETKDDNLKDKGRNNIDKLDSDAKALQDILSSYLEQFKNSLERKKLKAQELKATIENALINMTTEDESQINEWKTQYESMIEELSSISNDAQNVAIYAGNMRYYQLDRRWHTKAKGIIDSNGTLETTDIATGEDTSAEKLHKYENQFNEIKDLQETALSLADKDSNEYKKTYESLIGKKFDIIDTPNMDSSKPEKQLNGIDSIDAISKQETQHK